MIDHSAYPDTEHGDDFEDDYDRADYVHRICTAWDFGVPPEAYTVELFRGWRDVFDRFPIASSPAFHAFRATFRWPAVPPAPCFSTAQWEILDALEGRDDPCRDSV
ncbi:MAG: hypothetical protein QOD51_1691 [Candidatus Eremiobacteraeota bacterium]|nr:hypothetical protein [Candidatus Eremiobacteraeota bacterium]